MNIVDFGITSVAAITVIVYLICQVCKAFGVRQRTEKPERRFYEEKPHYVIF